MGPPTTLEAKMHAPCWCCEELYRINKQLRLGWAGRDRRSDEELNAGSFAIIQLYHWSDVGPMDDLKTYRGFWDRELIPNAQGIVRFDRIWRGPLYDRRGGTSVDYDQDSRIPVFVCTIDDGYPHADGRRMSTDDVFDGSFLSAIEYWQVPLKRRVREKYLEMGHRIADNVMDIGREAGKFLHKESQRAGHTSPCIAKKFTKDAMNKVEEDHEKSRANLQNYYLEHI